MTLFWQVALTISNAKDKKSVVKGQEVIVSDVHTIREYSCVQGLVALDQACIQDLPKIRAAMLKVQQRHPPTYN